MIHPHVIAPEDQLGKPKLFDYNLEALRGVAAIVVVWYHIVDVPRVLDPGYTPTGVWAFDPPGHLSVLVFFVLSGYVIGLSHANPITRNTIGSYLKKRLVRIYPIYALAILLAVITASAEYSNWTILSHFTMTHALTSPVIVENAPAWSLHYEMLYYLLFIPISYFRVNPVVMAISCFIIGTANFYLHSRFGTPPILSAYAFGFTFWLSGLVLSLYKPAPAAAAFPVMVSMIFLLLSLEKFDVLSTVLSKLSLRIVGTELTFPASVPWYQRTVTFHDFAFLPYCLIAIMVFSSKDFKFKKSLVFLLLFVPAATFYSYYKHYSEQDNSLLVAPITFYIIALIIYLFSGRLNLVSERLIKLIIPTGGISYGLYIIHYPILFTFKQVPFFSGTSATFSIRLIIYLAVCVVAAWFLEKMFQPWIKKRLSLN